jgi:hypothetical protein
MAASISPSRWVQTQLDAYPSLGAIPDETFFKMRALADKVEKLVFYKKNFVKDVFTDDLSDMGALFPNLNGLVVVQCTINHKPIEADYDCVKYFLPHLENWKIDPKPPLLEHSEEDRNNYSGPKYASFKINQLLHKYHLLNNIPPEVRHRVRSLAHLVRKLDFSYEELTTCELEKIAYWFPNIKELTLDQCNLNGVPLKKKKQIIKYCNQSIICHITLKPPDYTITTQLQSLTLEEKKECTSLMPLASVPKRQILSTDTSPKTRLHGLTQNSICTILRYLGEQMELSLASKPLIGTWQDIEHFFEVCGDTIAPMSRKLWHKACKHVMLKQVIEKPPLNTLGHYEVTALDRLKETAASLITFLDLRTCEVADSLDWLKRIQETYSQINTLFLPRSTLTPQYVEILGKFEKHRTLDISICEKTNIGLLKALPNLENLTARVFFECITYLLYPRDAQKLLEQVFPLSVPEIVPKNNYPLQAAHIREIAGMHNLRELDLGYCDQDVNDEALSLLNPTNLPNLHAFSIYNSKKITRHTIAALKGHDLIKLSLYDCPEIDDIAISTIVDQFPNLRELRIGSPKLTDKAFFYLSELEYLQNLVVGNHDSITRSGWENLSPCQKLEKLVITSEKNFNDLMFLTLDKIPELHQVSFVDFFPSEKMIELFRRVKSQQQCDLIFKDNKKPIPDYISKINQSQETKSL